MVYQYQKYSIRNAIATMNNLQLNWATEHTPTHMTWTENETCKESIQVIITITHIHTCRVRGWSVIAKETGRGAYRKYESRWFMFWELAGRREVIAVDRLVDAGLPLSRKIPYCVSEVARGWAPMVPVVEQINRIISSHDSSFILHTTWMLSTCSERLSWSSCSESCTHLEYPR